MNRQVLKTRAEVLNWFHEDRRGKFAFDTETTSLRYDELKIVGISFCDGKDTCYIDLWENQEQEDILITLSEVFTYRVEKLIAHNIKFDLKVLYKYEILNVTDKIFCTLVAAHLLDENQPKKLKPHLVKKYLGIQDAKEYDDVKERPHSQKFYEYAMDDAEYAWKLHEVFGRKLMYQDLWRLFSEIEMPFQFVLRDMEVTGVKVDGELMKKLEPELEQAKLDLEKKLYESAGLNYGYIVTMFSDEVGFVGPNLNSSQQVADIIENRLGIVIEAKTPTGKPCVDVKSMKELENKHEFIGLMMKYNKVTQALDTFVKPFQEFIDSDGRIRASFNDTGARTGRMSCSHPNLQQLPKNKTDSPVDFRQCFIAPKGKKFVVVDFSGQELRVTGHVSQDRRMLSAFNSGKDIHLMFARKCFDLQFPSECLFESHEDYKKYKEQYYEERDIAKNGVSFPLIYGSTAYGISKSLNIPEDTAQKYIDDFFELYPAVKEAIETTKRQISTHMYVRNGVGRKRRFVKVTNKAFRQAFNFKVQGYCADLLRIACNAVRDWIINEHDNHVGDYVKLVMLVHDELVFEVSDKYLEYFVKEVKKIIEDATMLSLRLPVEIGIGQNYSEAK